MCAGRINGEYFSSLPHKGGWWTLWTNKIEAKILQCGPYWSTLFRDVHTFVESCNACQRSETISSKNEMPLNNILEVELFDVWDINFMGLFPPSYHSQYILVTIDYVSKWVEAMVLPTNDGKVVVKFLKKNIYKVWDTTSNYQWWRWSVANIAHSLSYSHTYYKINSVFSNYCLIYLQAHS